MPSRAFVCEHGRLKAFCGECFPFPKLEPTPVSSDPNPAARAAAEALAKCDLLGVVLTIDRAAAIIARHMAQAHADLEARLKRALDERDEERVYNREKQQRILEAIVREESLKAQIRALQAEKAQAEGRAAMLERERDEARRQVAGDMRGLPGTDGEMASMILDALESDASRKARSRAYYALRDVLIPKLRDRATAAESQVSALQAQVRVLDAFVAEVRADAEHNGWPRTRILARLAALAAAQGEGK